MANNHRKGAIYTTTWTNATGLDVSSGDPVVLAGAGGKKCRVGVAMTDIADTKFGEVAITGCFKLNKVSAAVIAHGESVNWDSSEAAVEDNAHTAASGDVAEFGMADEAAGNGDLVVNVWLDEPGTYTA